MKKIKLTAEDIAQAKADFEAYLLNTKFSDSKIDFSKSFTSTTTGERQLICMADYTYHKMLQYVLSTEKEIAWHGTVQRTANGFYIKQIFLYPQTVSGATVSTDQEKYNAWCEKLDDETINTMRFQGHSHVNMATTPSSVDTAFYDDLLNTLGTDDYYIFLIINKQQNLNFMIYDLNTNIIYEKEDIDFIILDETNKSFVEELKKEISANIEEHTVLYSTTKFGQPKQKSYFNDYTDDYEDFYSKYLKKNKKQTQTQTEISKRHVVILNDSTKDFEKAYPEYEGKQGMIKRNNYTLKYFMPYFPFDDIEVQTLRAEGWKIQKIKITKGDLK